MDVAGTPGSARVTLSRQDAVRTVLDRKRYESTQTTCICRHADAIKMVPGRWKGELLQLLGERRGAQNSAWPRVPLLDLPLTIFS